MPKMIEPLRLQPVFSPMLALWLGVLHLFSLIVIWQLSLPLGVKWAVSLVQVGYLIWQIRMHLLRNLPQSISELHLDTDGRWWLVQRDGTRQGVELTAESFVRPWLLVLVFHTDRFAVKRSLFLPPDSLGADLARRLRIHLLQTAGKQAEGQSGSTGSKGE